MEPLGSRNPRAGPKERRLTVHPQTAAPLTEPFQLFHVHTSALFPAPLFYFHWVPHAAKLTMLACPSIRERGCRSLSQDQGMIVYRSNSRCMPSALASPSNPSECCGVSPTTRSSTADPNSRRSCLLIAKVVDSCSLCIALADVGASRLTGQLDLVIVEVRSVSTKTPLPDKVHTA